MKFQLKSIAAAVALAAVAGHAAAAIQNTTATGGSELVFYVTNEAEDGSARSFVLDLGIKLADFQTNSAAAMSSFTTAISTNSAWAQYLSAVGGDLSTSYWGVVGGQRNGTTYTAATTIRLGEDTSAQASPATKGAIGTPMNLAISATNMGAGNDNNVAINSGYYSAGDDNWFNYYGHDAGANWKFAPDSLVGESAAFGFFNATKTLAQSTYDGTFTFDGSNLNYAVAAVPEPGSYAMMLAGLMLVGGMVRRRRG